MQIYGWFFGLLKKLILPVNINLPFGIDRFLNGSLVNGTSSAFCIYKNTKNSALSAIKASTAILPHTKVLHYTAASLNGASAVCSVVCCLSGLNPITSPLGVTCSAVGLACSHAATSFSIAAHCSDPVNGFTSAQIEACIETALKDPTYLLKQVGETIIEE